MGTFNLVFQDNNSLLTSLSSETSSLYPALLALIVVSSTIVINSSINSAKNGSKNGCPPKAPTGLFETIKLLSGSNFPWFLLQTAKELNSSIFRFSKLEYLFGCPMVVVVGEAQTALKILKDPQSTKPMAIYGPLREMFLGVGSIFVSNGSYWHSRRKGVSPAFSSRHVKRMNEVAIEKADEWINGRLTTLIENDEAFDVGEEMIGITFSAIAKTAFQYDVSDEENKTYTQELALAFKEFFFKSATNPLRKPLGLFFSERRRAHRASQWLTSFNLNLIDRYRKLDNPVKDTIIDRIMKNDAYKNDLERAADVGVLIIAGHDTTAYSMAFTLKELAKHPEEMQKLQQSLSEHSTENFDKSHVLRNVMKEAMRLHPVLPLGSTRTLGKDIETNEGYMLPKGSVAFMPFILNQRDPKVFKDPDVFNPSRWENPTNEMNEAFYPFSSGKQNCVGQSLANAEMYSVVARICSAFDLELVEEGKTEYFVTMKPYKTMIKAHRRSS